MADLTKFLTEQFNQAFKHKGASKAAATEPVVTATAQSRQTSVRRERSRGAMNVDPGPDRQIADMASVRPFTSAQMDQRGLVYAGMADKDVLNAYRELRTRLLQHAQGDNFICMVSSISADYSATMVATNLAAAIALDQSKTSLLIDCNIDELSIAQLLDVQSCCGVTDFLDDGQIEVQDIICPSAVPRMRVIPGGANIEHSAEYFSSRRMLEFFGALKARYADRYVIVNAPPILASAEAKILAELCDLTVLVLPYGKVVQSQLQSASAMIAAEKLAGIVCPPE